MLPPTLRILIADDDAGDRKMIKRILKQSGLVCDCVETASIEEALNVCERGPCDCAIVDYRLPGEDGLDGLSSLHKRFPYMAMIMMTGQGDEMVAAEAIKRGASDYIPKTHLQPQAIKRSATNAVEKAMLRRKIAQQQDEMGLFNRLLVHDLKAPLNSIYSFAGLIEEGLREGKGGQVSEYSRRISRAAQRTSALIDMLHQFTKAEDRMVFEPVQMSQVLDDALSNLEPVLQARSGCVTYANLPEVTGNAPQLMQLSQNLIGNGVKYCSAPEPRIHITAEPQGGDGWLFSVQDNGIGIPKEKCGLIFEPFRRLHGAGQYEGTGLGLATCKKIVERHGGRIWCESEEGKGSTFLFTLHGSVNENVGGRAQSAAP